MIRKSLVVSIVFLFFATSVTPVVLSFDEPEISDDFMENMNYDSYHISEIKNNIIKMTDSIDSEPTSSSELPDKLMKKKTTQAITSGSMDSAWPMLCHDTYHTGRSPYSTANNPGFEKWEFHGEGWIRGSPVIDDDGLIYYGDSTYIHCLYPTGTAKWNFTFHYGWVSSAPAIDENGNVYFGTIQGSPNRFYSISSNGTKNWDRVTGDVYSSPAIGDNGTVYFGEYNGRINAMYSNGTLKWEYITNSHVLSPPAIGNDGTVYCGSHDGNLYALYPNNGTKKWHFNTNDWIRASSSIAEDGTIYVCSYDDHLYALYPNGTMKWRFNTGWGSAGNPSIASDGTIYVSTNYLYAVNPDGTEKWRFSFGEGNYCGESCPAISADGTVYVGVYIGDGVGGELIAVNPDGTEKWRSGIICNEGIGSSPAIAEDGTVYIGSLHDHEIYPGGFISQGYLHAFNELDSNAPETPIIMGETDGRVGVEYEYTFSSIDPNGDDVYYYIDWGHEGWKRIKGWFGPYASGEEVIVSHTWDYRGTFIITAKAKDANNLCSDWGTLEVTMPVNKPIQYPLLELFKDRFPFLHQLFQYFLQQRL